MLIRFPLELPPIQKPKRRPSERWSRIVGHGLLFLAALLLLVYFVFPLLEMDGVQ